MLSAAMGGAEPPKFDTSNPKVSRANEIDTNCKVRELALKVLHQVWKAWFERVECVVAPSNEAAASTAAKWHNHWEFRNNLV